LEIFLQEDQYIDYSSKTIQNKVIELFTSDMTKIKKTKVAYEFVRDEIPHSFDCNAKIIVAKASDVLLYKTGICHAKANLLAALLRSQGIPTGFCFQHITLAKDDSLGYCVHAFNAVFVNNKWIKLDARGNKQGVNAQFSTDEPILAYQNRKEFDEYFFDGIFANPHKATMLMLEKAESLQDIMDNIPEYVSEKPDILEE
jgi:transglutaminase-like putative cysteine protease